MSRRRRARGLLSIEQFDENDTNVPVFTSPRTVEACKRQGIQANELAKRYTYKFEQILINRPLESFKEKGLSVEARQRLYEHYEQRRLGMQLLCIVVMTKCAEKIRIILEERQSLIDEGWVPESHSGAVRALPADESSTLVAQEQKRLEAIKRKQQQEIEQLMAYEAKMQKIREDQQRKLEQERAREEEQRRERLRKLREYEERKVCVFLLYGSYLHSIKKR